MIFNIAPGCIRYKIPRANGCSSGIAHAGACLPRHMVGPYQQSACDPAVNSFFHEVLGLHDVNAACLGEDDAPQIPIPQKSFWWPTNPRFSAEEGFTSFPSPPPPSPKLEDITFTRLHSMHTTLRCVYTELGTPKIDRPRVRVAWTHLLIATLSLFIKTKDPFSGLEVPDGPALRIPGTVAKLGCSPPRAHATLSQLHEQATSSPQCAALRCVALRCVALLYFLSSAGNHSKDRSSMKWETSPAWHAWVRPACPSDPVKRTAH